jgi:hypothetical protein
MSDDGYNEVTIVVNTVDGGQAQRDAIKASAEALGKTQVQIPVTLSDPVTAAWRAQVNAEIKAAAKDALTIPVEADTEDLRAEVAGALADAQSMARLDVPINLEDADVFRASVSELVASTRAEIAAGIQVPVTLDTSGAERQVADLTPQTQSSADVDNLRPSYTPAPLGNDPYAAARAQLATEAPIEVPVVAADPITAAWVAQVTTQVKQIAAQAVQIPVTPDTAAFREQVVAALAELSDLRESVPLEVAGTDEFRMAVTEQVNAISQTVRAVITVDADDASLDDMRAKILAAADASSEEAQAQQNLADAMAKGNAGDIAKAQEALAAAERDSGDAAKSQAAAMDLAAGAEDAASTGAKTAATSMRSLNEAMGPLWMVMNVAQIAMMALYSSSTSTASAAQDLSQQLISLGTSGADAVQQLTGNDALKSIAGDLTGAGTSAAAFAQAYSGSLTDAESYTQKLVASQQQAGAVTTQLSQQIVSGTASGKAAGESMTASVQSTSISIQDLAQRVDSGAVSMGSLSQANQDAVTHYNQVTQSVNAAKQALSDLQTAQAVALGQLESAPGSFATESASASAYGLSINDVEQAYDNLKWANPKDTLDQVAEAFNSGMVAANQSASAIVASVQQEAQAVTQASASAASANHSLEQSAQGVATAEHGVQQAQLQYNTALQAEQAAQQAVGAARAAAAQQLIDLTLQQADASASALSANVSLFDAQAAAAKLGVTPGNVTAISQQQVTAQNEDQVKAAIALVEAQNQVADSQNTSTQAQQALNTAQQEGIDNSPGVVSANKALEQAQQQVTDAAYAEQQAHEQVANALYAEQQAAVAVTTAETALAAAQKTVADNTNLATAAGQQTEQMVLSLANNLRASGLPLTTQYNDLVSDTAVLFGGSTTAAQNYLKSIDAIPQNFKFVTTAVASVDMTQIDQLESQLHMSGTNLSRADGGPISGPGGPRGDKIHAMLSDGEYVVNAKATSENRGTLEAINAGHYADGGLVGANINLATAGVGYQDAVDTLTVMGMAAPASLPAYVASPTPSFSSTGVSTGSVGGSAAANKAIVQQVVQEMSGWGTGAEWNALNYVMMRESGYNSTAQNPTSSAYGMFQFLDSTWKSYGVSKTSDPTQQAIGGDRYITARYGDPIAAAAHEQAYNWYAGGGPAGGVVGINDGGPELVNLPNGSQIMPAANTANAMAGTIGNATRNTLDISFSGATNSPLALMVMHGVRTGGIQLNVNGQRVQAG